MRRRDFIKGIAGSAAAWPLAARAQQPIPAIGYLGANTLDNNYTMPQIGAFRQGLKESGLVEERDLRSYSMGGWPLRSVAGARN
jgi:putative tryptophan/tyrosine transport system substrate-binding protein